MGLNPSGTVILLVLRKFLLRFLILPHAAACCMENSFEGIRFKCRLCRKKSILNKCEFEGKGKGFFGTLQRLSYESLFSFFFQGNKHRMLVKGAFSALIVILDV